ncbi:MAG: hypothetical protein ABIK31_00235 [candidate division WOR-3 bacterium]
MRFIFLLAILCSLGFSWIVISNAPYDQRQSSSAFLNNQYLVVWSDARAWQTYQANVIYGARVSASGLVLNPNGFLINGGYPDRLLPKVCASSSDWLVIWQEGC